MPACSAEGTTLLCWTPRKEGYTTLSLDQSGVIRETRRHDSPAFDTLLIGRWGSGREPGALLIDRRELHMMSAIDIGKDSARIVWSGVLPFGPDEMLQGDLNNDGYSDVLLISRNVPGMVPLIGDGAGRFRVGKTIAPDDAVGSATLTHLNNDALLDLVYYEWVRSELHLLYGVGGGRFLDQSTIPVQGTVARMIAAETTPEPILDLVLLFDQPAKVEIWQGDGLGDFRPGPSIPLESPASFLEVLDINNDGLKDFLLGTGSTVMSIYFGGISGALTDRIEYSSGRLRCPPVQADVNEDGLVDLILLDSDGGQLKSYWNGNAAFTLTDSLDVPTGLSPAGVWIGTGRPGSARGLTVVSEGSRQLELFEGSHEGALLGPRAIDLPFRPRYLAMNEQGDSARQFVISYPEDRGISFLSYDDRTGASVNSVIPDAGLLEPLKSVRTPAGGSGFFCYNAEGARGNPALTLFQDLGAGKFIERSFSLTVPDLLFGATVGDVNHDGWLDLVYVYQNATSRRYELAVAPGDSDLEFRVRSWVLELEDTVVRKSYLYLNDFNRDGNQDLLLCFPSTARILKLAFGDGAGTFDAPRTVMERVWISDRSQMQICDLNGDGFADVVANDRERGGLLWLRGGGDGSFGPPDVLVEDGTISAFAVGDLNGDDAPDVACSHTKGGFLRIYDGRMLRARHHAP